jgi:anaerobic ribonucleoside-triphosphate reductase activating protein
LNTSHFFSREELNIAAIAPQTRALGPGLRAVIWVQGCPLNCKGCIAPTWIPYKPANIMTVDDILAKIKISEVDGITFSGGEPIEQAEALAELSVRIRQIKDVDLICFTGYQYERLRNSPPNPGVTKLLAQIDVLIDGPYVQSKNDSIGLRGSSNQRIIYLTERLRKYMLEFQKRNVEVSIADGEMSLIGIPTPEIKSAMDHITRTDMERMMHHERL